MIYLDNAATSFPKPDGVYRAMDAYARTALANPGRAGHRLAVAAKHTLDDARLRLNRFVNGAGAERIAFALNGTDALNMAVKGVLEPPAITSSPPTWNTTAFQPPAGEAGRRRGDYPHPRAVGCRRDGRPRRHRRRLHP